MNPIKRSVRRFSFWLLEATDAWEPVERLSVELEQELLRHPGEWVAMTHERLLASGDNAVEVLAAARESGVETPILYKVPEAGVSYFLHTYASSPAIDPSEEDDQPAGLASATPALTGPVSADSANQSASETASPAASSARELESKLAAELADGLLIEPETPLAEGEGAHPLNPGVPAWEQLAQPALAGALGAIIDGVLAANPDAVADYRAGRTAAAGFLFGQVMKEAHGLASVVLVQRALQQRLSEQALA